MEKPSREVLNREWDQLVDDLFALEEPTAEQVLKFNPYHDEKGRFAEKEGASSTSGGPEWKQPLDKNGRPIPIKVKTVEEAVPLVLKGKVVELETVKEASTLVDKLAKVVEEMRKAGDKATDFDLCNVSVKGTNLFCAQRLQTKEYPEGIPRLEMPQLGGKPVPGSAADKLPRNPWDPEEVNASGHFIKHLVENGIKTTTAHMNASELRASQRELIGSKIAKMISDTSFNPGKNPIFISRDNYVIDGHHRWAAVIGRDTADGTLGTLEGRINVIRVDAPITEVLHRANVWAKKFGIQQVAGVKKISILTYTGDLTRRW